jgi:hypothetical protein
MECMRDVKEISTDVAAEECGARCIFSGDGGGRGAHASAGAAERRHGGRHDGGGGGGCGGGGGGGQGRGGQGQGRIEGDAEQGEARAAHQEHAAQGGDGQGGESGGGGGDSGAGAEAEMRFTLHCSSAARLVNMLVFWLPLGVKGSRSATFPELLGVRCAAGCVAVFTISRFHVRRSPSV